MEALSDLLIESGLKQVLSKSPSLFIHLATEGLIDPNLVSASGVNQFFLANCHPWTEMDRESDQGECIQTATLAPDIDYFDTYPTTAGVATLARQGFLQPFHLAYGEESEDYHRLVATCLDPLVGQENVDVVRKADWFQEENRQELSLSY